MTRHTAAPGEVVTTARPRRARRATPNTLQAPTPPDEDISTERALSSRTAPCIVLTPDVQVDLARWAELTEQARQAGQGPLGDEALMQACSYAHAILWRLTRANPVLTGGK